MEGHFGGGCRCVGVLAKATTAYFCSILGLLVSIAIGKSWSSSTFHEPTADMPEPFVARLRHLDLAGLSKQF
jgi:hypothetical protein